MALKHSLKTLGRHAKDHFVPSPENDYHPHALKHRVLLGYSAILILLKAITIVGPLALPSSSLYSSAVTPQNIVALTNQTRQNLGLATLTASELLSEAARAKAQDMVTNGYFAHTSPSGISPWEWFKKVGYVYRVAGENLAVRFQSAEGVTAGWLASPTHRSNIVNPKYSEIGVAVTSGTYQGTPATYVVQLFGLPAGAATSVEATTPATSSASPTTTTSTTAGATVAGTETNVPSSSDTTLTINESDVLITPLAASYRIEARIASATAVSATLGDEHVSLTQRQGTDVWEGEVSYTPGSLGRTGERLLITAGADGAEAVTKNVAILAPQVETQQLYTFHEGTDRFTTFLGRISIHNIDDQVRKIYLAFVVVLAAGVLFNVFFVQMRTRQITVLGHTMVVMALAVILSLI